MLSSAIGPALPLAQSPFHFMRAFHRLNLLIADSFPSCVHAPTRIDGCYEKTPFLTANFWFMSAQEGGRREAHMVTPRCFRSLWPVLCAVAPQLRGCVCHLTPQDVDDLLFSLSREYVRQAGLA
jgi:hypothetical protein